MNRTARLLIFIGLVVASPHTIEARKGPAPQMVTDAAAPAQFAGKAPGAMHAPGKNAAGVIQWWTFDNGSVADPQGWTTHDRNFQPAFFHVEAFGAPMNSKVMWCGAQTACAVPFTCDYLALPGYGNGWRQNFVSRPFSPNSGWVEVQFDIWYDCEPSYDNVFVEYASQDEIWHELWPSFTGVGFQHVAIALGPGSFSGPVRFRVRFHSDSYGSNEDGNYISNVGACQVDNIVINDLGNPTPPLDTQDFSAEPAGATATLDGDWQAYGVTYGNYTALFEGEDQLQEDPQAVNTTFMWGFYDDSPELYMCVNPAQWATPKKIPTLGTDYYQWSEIQSPIVSLEDFTPTEPVLLSFDVYRDLPLDNLVFYDWRVRSNIAGAWQPWQTDIYVYYGAEKTWKTATFDMRPMIPGAATEIQVAIGAKDLCEYWCGSFGSGACHTHAPLIDNIRITTSNTGTGMLVQTAPLDPTTNTTPVLLTFDEVTTAGLTNVTTAPTTGGMPYGATTYFEISTSAVYTGDIDLQVEYSEAALLIPEASVRLLHWDTSLTPDRWVDVTTSLNTSTNRIYGTTTSLSPFVLAQAIPTGVDESPSALTLHQNVPNPFNPTTTISFVLPEQANVRLSVYDVRGALVRVLADDDMAPGRRDVTWDGRDARGIPVASGVYFYELVAGKQTLTRKMMLVQ